jgi:tetratricopeptide (TPR) repeat protein
VSPRDACPPRVKLLALIAAGEHVPHLATCQECAAFVAAATDAVTAFADRDEVEEAVAARIDQLLGDTPQHRWVSAIVAASELRHSVVIRDLLRRADDWYGRDPRAALYLTTATVELCNAMTACGNSPAPELRFDVLKEHQIMLRQTHRLDEANNVLVRLWAAALDTDDPQRYRTIASLCAAILYAEPDVAQFDAAIEFAETAGAVLEECGDRRRAVLARHLKAHVLVVRNQFEEAISPLRSVIDQIIEVGGSERDRARAHGLLALALVHLGTYDEAIEHARLAESLHKMCGDIVDAARSAHIAARGISAKGRFVEVREEFAHTAAIVLAAGILDVWCLMRFDFIAAALEDDEGADVRAEVEEVARVCMTVAARESTSRQQHAAEALDYLRRLALRDALTSEIVGSIRNDLST